MIIGNAKISVNGSMIHPFAVRGGSFNLLSPVQTEAALLANKSHHCTLLLQMHVASLCTPCCMFTHAFACYCPKFETGQTCAKLTYSNSAVTGVAPSGCARCYLVLERLFSTALHQSLINIFVAFWNPFLMSFVGVIGVLTTLRFTLICPMGFM